LKDPKPRSFATHDVLFNEDRNRGIEFMPALDDFGLAVSKVLLRVKLALYWPQKGMASITEAIFFMHINGMLTSRTAPAGSGHWRSSRRKVSTGL
jgi:hypothetical protein